MEEPFDMWAIVEIMGRQRFAGRVTERTIAGTSMLQIDIPKTKSQDAFTKFFGPGSVHSLTPTTEELATAVAESIGNAPVSIYALPEWMRDRLKTPQQRLPNFSDSDVEEIDDYLDDDDEDADE